MVAQTMVKVGTIRPWERRFNLPVDLYLVEDWSATGLGAYGACFEAAVSHGRRIGNSEVQIFFEPPATNNDIHSFLVEATVGALDGYSVVGVKVTLMSFNHLVREYLPVGRRNFGKCPRCGYVPGRPLTTP